jgi:hypothetical protein
MYWPGSGEEPTLVGVVLVPLVALCRRGVVVVTARVFGEELFSLLEDAGHDADDRWGEGRMIWVGGGY